jgi:hypothetical protein
MPGAEKLTKAKLMKVTGPGDPDPPDAIEVQFNPDTLRVSFSNQVIQPSQPGNAAPNGTQWVGQGTTRLALTLIFDVAAAGHGDGDVRQATEPVVALITPGGATTIDDGTGTGSGDAKPLTVRPVPRVRMKWGTFKFEGFVDTIEETLELFSPDGRPLRSTMALALSTQEISHLYGDAAAAAPAGAPAVTPGSVPLAAAPANAPLQTLADGAGAGASWPQIALNNKIENPRRLPTGQLIDLRIG